MPTIAAQLAPEFLSPAIPQEAPSRGAGEEEM
jgi:hypothetical protein